jgi:hypothetical protein
MGLSEQNRRQFATRVRRGEPEGELRELTLLQTKFYSSCEKGEEERTKEKANKCVSAVVDPPHLKKGNLKTRYKQAHSNDIHHQLSKN